VRAGTILTVALMLALAGAAGWWLFADTVRYYSQTDESGPLRVSFWGDFQEYEMWKEFRAAWEAKHPDIPIKYEYVALGSQYTPKIRRLLVADAAPDVFLFQDEPLPGFLADGKFEDLTAYLNTPGEELALGEYWKKSVEAFGRWEGRGAERKWHQYGIPIWGGCNVLFYHREIFARAGIRVQGMRVQPDPLTGRGPPGLRREGGGWVLNDQTWTVDEFVELARMLTVDDDGDGRIDQFGFWLPGRVYWLPWHWALGASVLDSRRRRITWYGPQCERSLQLWQDLLHKYHVAPTQAELGIMGPNVGFMTGRVAMYCQGPWVMPFLNATNSPYDLLHMPRGPSGVRATRITWDAVVMFAGSRKKELAWRFIRHLASRECQDIVARYQRAIPALSAAGDAFTAGNKDVAVGKFVEALVDYGRNQPISEHWELMDLKWRQAKSGLLSIRPEDRLTPAETIGQFLSNKELCEKLPPLDEAEAERYRQIYRKRKEGK